MEHKNVAYMSSHIGDLPINSIGMRMAVDEIARLRAENERVQAELESVNTSTQRLDDENLRLIKERDAAALDIVTLLARGGCGACSMCASYSDERCKLEGPVCEPKWRGTEGQK